MYPALYQSKSDICEYIINFLLTEHKGRTKTTEGQYSPGLLELAKSVSSLLYGTRARLVLSLPAFENKKYTAYERLHGNGLYGKILTKKEPIRML